MGLEEKAQEREIGEFRYKVWPVPFGVGTSSLMRLLRILSPILSRAMYAAANAGGANVELLSAAGILETLPTALNEGDITYFRTLFGTASSYAEGGSEQWETLIVNKKKGDFQEIHFAGRYGEFLQWLLFCVEVNYGNFFDGMKPESGAVGAFLEKMRGATAPKAKAKTAPTEESEAEETPT